MDIIKTAGMAIGGLFVGLVVVLFGIVGIFLFAIFGALIGAITGWIVAQTPILGEAVRNGFSSIFEVESPDLVAIGAMLGFIAGFFKNWESKNEHKHDWKSKDFESYEDMGEIPEIHIDVEPKKRSRKKK